MSSPTVLHAADQRMIAAYVSGHGYGHSTRAAEVLRAVRALEPAVPIAVVTSAPEGLYRDAIRGAFEFRALACDVGLAQKDALVIDEAETVARWRAFQRGQAARVANEAAWLRARGASLVLGDVPPLAFAAAHAAGVPSVGLANFSWDWIYRHLSPRQPALAQAAGAAAADYARASLLLQLPFAGDLAAFPVREAIPLVARRPRVSRAEARARLGLDLARPAVLLSFGGLGLPGFEPAVLARAPGLQFVVSDPGTAAPNVRVIGRGALSASRLGYHELVAAADVVITKPGYGIVSDAIAAGTRIVYTDRGDFPEYPILVRGMQQWLPCAYVTNDAVRQGALAGAVREVLDRSVPPPPRLDGAEVAARRLLRLARSRATPASR